MVQLCTGSGEKEIRENTLDGLVRSAEESFFRTVQVLVRNMLRVAIVYIIDRDLGTFTARDDSSVPHTVSLREGKASLSYFRSAHS